MSLLLSLLVALVLQLWVPTSSGECALGSAEENTRWIGSEGRLKYPNYEISPADIDGDYGDNTFGFQAGCSDSTEYNDDLDEHCNCTFINSSGGIYSCSGDLMNSLPNLTRIEPVDVLGMYVVRYARNVHEIKSRQFSGLKMKEIRIEYSETLHLENKAFDGIWGLRTLRLTHNNLEKIGQPSLIFAGLVNLTILDLSYNQITGWEPTYGHENTTVLPNLELLDLSGNPLSYLNNDTFQWLRGSKLENLILNHCDIKTVDTGAIDPLLPTLATIDVGNSYIPQSMILNLLVKFATTSQLHGLSLSKIGLTSVPFDILELTNGSLLYLSLYGNTIRTLGDELKRTSKLPYQKDDLKLSLKPNDERVLPAMPLLQELDLRSCSIYFIRRDIFDIVPNLRVLLLSHNQILSFKTLTAQSFPNLGHLDLSNNPLFATGINLTQFPALHTIDLSYTNARRIYRSTFQSVPASLERLSLCHCNLRFIHNSSFASMATLKLLDLSGNVRLGQTLSSHMFEGLTSLQQLHVSEISMRTLTRSNVETIQNLQMTALSNLHTLQRLDISKNDILSLDYDIMTRLTRLESLDISDNYIRSWNEPMLNSSNLINLNIEHNHLSYITAAMLKDFKNLHTLVLSSNPFVCGCECKRFLDMVSHVTDRTCNRTHRDPRTNEFHVKIVKTNSGFKVANSTANFSDTFTENWDTNHEYVCMQKTSPGEIKYIKFSEAQCKSSNHKDNSTEKATEQTQDYNTGEEEADHKDAIIIIVVASILIVAVFAGITYWKWWYIRYFAVQVKNATVLTFLSNEEEQLPSDRIYNYDIFVSYSDHDRNWVLDNLLPNLELDSNVKVCLHERDFQIGISILENIIQSIDRSRSILLVVSQSFLRSQWCQFELHLAQHRLLETRREELILLFLEDIPSKKRPKTLDYLMRTKTYIIWPKNEDSESTKMFWKRLHRAILSNANQKDKKISLA